MRGFRAWWGRGRRSKGKRERESKFFFLGPGGEEKGGKGFDG